MDQDSTLSRARTAARSVTQGALGAALLFTGTGHLTWLREDFRAQVPSWIPVPEDVVVVGSGVAELALGAALAGSLALRGPRRPRARVVAGLATAAFFVAIFPGNVGQYVEGVDAFGLTTDRGRLVRLFFQPVLVLWALWPTGAGRWLLERGGAASSGDDGGRLSVGRADR